MTKRVLTHVYPPYLGLDASSYSNSIIQTLYNLKMKRQFINNQYISIEDLRMLLEQKFGVGNYKITVSFPQPTAYATRLMLVGRRGRL